MSQTEIERAPGRDNYETQIGGVSGPVHSGRGDIVHVEKIELAATRAADALQRALSTDEETRAQLLEALRQLSTLQAQLGEWKELHHILHEVLTTFSPFYADLRALNHIELEAVEWRALLRGWRSCQTEVDRLMDFESSVEHIRQSLRREEVPAARPDWGTRIASLQREVEDRLREKKCSIEGLVDLADEFERACDCYLTLADWELRRVVEKVQRLYTLIIGGLL
ncbi:MAG: hypothetical protein DRI48_03145 [Chloroflexi bacterium]|nr:MAG: hypothetical protein DRI48_03145 [Chloroflexota bacterium]